MLFVDISNRICLQWGWAEDVTRSNQILYPLVFSARNGVAFSATKPCGISNRNRDGFTLAELTTTTNLSYVSIGYI